MTPEQNQLFQKAQQSLNASKYLLTGGYYDFALSRAYYTMFYIASAILLGDNLTCCIPVKKTYEEMIPPTPLIKS